MLSDKQNIYGSVVKPQYQHEKAAAKKM